MNLLPLLAPLALAQAASLASASVAPAPVASGPVQEASSETATTAGLEWFDGTFSELQAKAKEEGRPMFLHFWAKWSQKSIALLRVYKDPAVVAALDGYLCFSIDSVLKPGRPTELARRFNAEKPPRLLFLDSEGNVVDHLLELADERIPTPEELVAEIERIHSGRGTIPGLAAEVAAAPDDLELRFRYAKKLRHVGQVGAFDVQIAEMKKRDPEEASRPLRELKIEGWQTILGDYTRGHNDPRKSIAANELAEFLQDETDPGLLYSGWSSVASYWSNQALMAKRGYRHDEARKHSAQFIAALRNAQEHVTEKDLRLTGAYTPALIYQFRDYIDDDAKALALSLAEKCVQLMPQSSDAMDSYACALYMNGQKAKAIEKIHEARKLDPSNWILQERLKEFQ